MRPLERIDPGNSQRSFVSVFDTFESQKDVCIHGLLLSIMYGGFANIHM